MAPKADLCRAEWRVEMTRSLADRLQQLAGGCRAAPPAPCARGGQRSGLRIFRSLQAPRSNTGWPPGRRNYWGERSLHVRIEFRSVRPPLTAHGRTARCGIHQFQLGGCSQEMASSGRSGMLPYQLIPAACIHTVSLYFGEAAVLPRWHSVAKIAPRRRNSCRAPR